MHNIKNIRNNLDEFKSKIQSRNMDINIEEIVSLDKENRTLIQKKENLEKEKKDISKSQDKSLFQKSKKISSELEKILYEAMPVLDHGFVRVVDYMGDDTSIVQSARVSYGKGTKKVSTDEGLIKY